jgi:hypothetical protein
MPGGAEKATLASEMATRGKNTSDGPGHHEIAAGARFDLLDQAVTHQIDRRGDKENVTAPSTGSPAPAQCTGNSQPTAALRASAPGLGAAHLGPRRRMVRHDGDLGAEGAPALLRLLQPTQHVSTNYVTGAG